MMMLLVLLSKKNMQLDINLNRICGLLFFVLWGFFFPLPTCQGEPGSRSDVLLKGQKGEPGIEGQVGVPGRPGAKGSTGPDGKNGYLN